VILDHEARFWSRVEIRGTDDCWLWKGNFYSPGKYGRFKANGHTSGAHRWSWQFTNGLIPDGLIVRHACDVPACVNPKHLLLGTHLDNGNDKAIRGRAPKGAMNGQNLHPERTVRGESHHNSKLCEADIPFIRHWLKSGYFIRDIASAFGVSTYPIMCIKKDKWWRHV
jgi:hypothetical protein